jgi:hypothetical protein
MGNYEIVIGLETHIQLNTQTKIFCDCKADSWEAEPNTNICPVCSGLPGVLPVLNAEAVQKGALLAAAMHAEINPFSIFDRKNYFYPDLKVFRLPSFTSRSARGVTSTWHCPTAVYVMCALIACTWKKMPAKPRWSIATGWLTSTAAACH